MLGMLVGWAFFGKFFDIYGRKRAFMGSVLLVSLSGTAGAYFDDVEKTALSYSAQAWEGWINL